MAHNSRGKLLVALCLNGVTNNENGNKQDVEEMGAVSLLDSKDVKQSNEEESLVPQKKITDWEFDFINNIVPENLRALPMPSSSGGVLSPPKFVLPDAVRSGHCSSQSSVVSTCGEMESEINPLTSVFESVDEVIPLIQILETKVSDEEAKILSEISISKTIYEELKAIVKQGYYVSSENEEMRVLLDEHTVNSTRKLIEINSDFENENEENSREAILCKVYIESLDKNIGQLRDMALGNLLIKNKVEGIKRVDKRGRNRVSIEFSNLKAANSFLSSDFLERNNYEGYIPRHLVCCKGVIRNIDTNITEEFLLKNIKVESERPIIAVRRIKRKVQAEDQKINMVNTASVVVTFRGKSLPKSLSICYNFRQVEPYIAPVIKCFGCCRYGHIKAQCRSAIRCPSCYDKHSLSSCPNKDNPTCHFCEGNHLSTEEGISFNKRVCPESLNQKKIKELMAAYNYSYFEASKLCDNSVRKSFNRLNDDHDFPLLNQESSVDSFISRSNVYSSPKKNNFTFTKTIPVKKRILDKNENFYNNNLLVNPNGRQTELPNKRVRSMDSDIRDNDSQVTQYVLEESSSNSADNIIPVLKSMFSKDPKNLFRILKMKKKRQRSGNTSTAQQELYLNKLENDYILRRGVISPNIDPNYIDKKWEELSEQLNSVLNPKMWRKLLEEFCSPQISADSIKTGGGPKSKLSLTSLEERVLEVWGKITVAGSSGVPITGGLVIVATDSNNKTAELNHEFSVESEPESEYETIIL
ncbi:atp-dependent dna helicase [Holotrichia oblita]|uniref:Atp-dependent dna helicase n=1 Tax=Holotrichia oblita TaxID=644536 RepID=A0ACB9SMZ9_HOLOL|nr:atp-dependent dna helicase [Holotrichia oblita]